MKIFKRILLLLAIIALIAACGVYAFIQKDELAVEMGTLTKEIIGFAKNPSNTDKYIMAGLAAVMFFLAVLRAVRRRVGKNPSMATYLAFDAALGTIIYIMWDNVKNKLEEEQALGYVVMGLIGFVLFVFLLLALLPSKKAQKKPFTYKASGLTIYIITILFIALAIGYGVLAKEGFKSYGTVINKGIKYLFNYDKAWVDPHQKIVFITTICVTATLCMILALIKRKRNILPAIHVLVGIAVVAVYFAKKSRINAYIDEHVTDGTILNNVIFAFVAVMLFVILIDALFCLIDSIFSLFDPNEQQAVQVIDKKKSAEVKALAQSINEEPTEEKVEEPEEEAVEEEDEEEEEAPAPKPAVVAKPAQKNEYADEDFDDEEDEEDEDDDDDEEEEDDDDDEESNESVDDAREALRRRRELIRQRILAARYEDDDEDEDVEEDEVIGYDDEDDDDDEDEDEEDIEVVETPVSAEEPEEEVVEEEDIYGGLTDDKFDDEDEDDEEEEDEDDDEAPAYDPELDDDSESEVEEELEEAEELEEPAQEEIEEEIPEELDESEEEDEDDDEDDDDEESSEGESSEGSDDSSTKPAFARGKSKSMKEKLSTILDDDKRERYNAVRNELQSYKKVSERMSAKGDSFRYRRELIAKIDVGGKTLKLHLALNPADFEGSKYSFQDLSEKSKYQYTPLTLKLTSGRSVKHSIELIGMVAQVFGLEKNPKYEPKDYAAEIKEAFEIEKATEGANEIEAE